ncbi:MAG: MOSC domain-containing protein, partial [Casimicrobium sp.]
NPQRFITQREVPVLATVTAVVDGTGGLTLSCNGCDSLYVPMPTAANALCKVKVWSSEVIALDAGDAVAVWFEKALALPQGKVRLVRFHPQAMRDCNRLYAQDSGAKTMFADGYPLLVTNEASLVDLNRRMNRNADNAIPMNRFRPNLVLAGLPAWDEDHVDEIVIGDVVLKLVKPCVRCEVTATDQTIGARLSDEPLNTLARFRNNPDLGGVTFGWNAVVLREGSVAIGKSAQLQYRF